MLEVKIDVEYFVKMIEALKLVVNECYLKFTKQGMTIQCMDPAQIALVHMFMEKEGFDEYTCSRPLKCGVNLEHFGTILSLYKHPTDKLTLTIDELSGSDNTTSQADTEFMSILIEDQIGKRNTSFMMKLTKFKETVPKPPKIKTFRLLCMRSSDFSHICRDLENISDKVLLKFIERGIMLSVSSDLVDGHIQITDNDTMASPEEHKQTPKSKTTKDPTSQDESGDETRIPQLMSAVDEGSLNVAHLLGGLSLKGDKGKSFSLKYLNIFSKGEIFNSVVKIHLPGATKADKKEPLMLEFKIGKVGVIKYYLAPKLAD
ncbi:unnamed protein product [Moneuplotes crassus]|uniref:DNA sliding clamp PCNA n=1 Tax=Euplotes crassus TaxID=5936 RepID=A0AAD1XNX4_EUPCR|nr:unnamed protein product [Moneuplotes crassus]